MKVLFVSGGKTGLVGEVVKNQGESLTMAGIEIEYYVIKSGLGGYISAIPEIRKAFKRGNFDIVHAHYSLSAFAASMAGFFPLVVSLMGSDIYVSSFLRMVVIVFGKLRWSATIVKTHRMKKLLGVKKAFVIPNGVYVERFMQIPKTESRNRIGYYKDKKLIVFISNPKRPEKNFKLALDAINKLNNADIELMPVYNVPNEDIPFYLNAADALLLTSKWEGSVNVIKEAMACNVPIVSTNVGDVEWVIGKTEGCYLSYFGSNDLAEKLSLALNFSETIGRTNGRKRIFDLELDSKSVAEKLTKVYYQIAKGN